jgi:uncharacterized protein (TIGR03790 family)
MLLCLPAALAEVGETILLVVNRGSNLSRRIADYYISKRGIPLKNVCTLDILEESEEIAWERLRGAGRAAHRPLPAKANLREQMLYIVTTDGRAAEGGSGGGERPELREYGAVDSELTLLYSKMQGKRFRARARSPIRSTARRSSRSRTRAFPSTW